MNDPSFESQCVTNVYHAGSYTELTVKHLPTGIAWTESGNNRSEHHMRADAMSIVKAAIEKRAVQST